MYVKDIVVNIQNTSKEKKVETIINRFKGCQVKHINELLLLRNDLTKRIFLKLVLRLGIAGDDMPWCC